MSLPYKVVTSKLEDSERKLKYQKKKKNDNKNKSEVSVIRIL